MCDDFDDDKPQRKPRYVKGYAHLTQGQKDSVCKRYGHRFKIAKKWKTCLRCGLKTKLTTEDLLIMYFEVQALRNLRTSCFGAMAGIKPSNGATIAFNKWVAKN